MLLLQGLVGLRRTVQLQLLQQFGWGVDLDYCGIEWFVLETNRDRSVIFEIASKYHVSDPSVCDKPPSYIDSYGEESLRRNGVALTVSKRV